MIGAALAVSDPLAEWRPAEDCPACRPMRATVTDEHGRVRSLTQSHLAGLVAYDRWARTELGRVRAAEEFPRP